MQSWAKGFAIYPPMSHSILHASEPPPGRPAQAQGHWRLRQGREQQGVNEFKMRVIEIDLHLSSLGISKVLSIFCARDKTGGRLAVETNPLAHDDTGEWVDVVLLFARNY